MEKDPHQVLEGIMLACYAIKSQKAFFSVRYEYGDAFRSLESAVNEMYAAGLLGKNILGSGFELDVVLHRGAGAYICGEETGLIEALEGSGRGRGSSRRSRPSRARSASRPSSTTSRRSRASRRS
jgi:NADH-quinone oxidoreductase subunit F